MQLRLALFLCLAVGLLGSPTGGQARGAPPDLAQQAAPAILTGPAPELAHHAVAHLPDDPTPDEAVSDAATPDAAVQDAVEEAVARGDVAGEIVKQAYEQPLHFLMAAGPIWLSRYLTAVPWYGWSVVPALVYREWRQWPSDRWWDPPLDAAFLILGVVGATWRGQRARRPALPLRWLRRGQAAFRPWFEPVRLIRSGS